MSIKEFVSNVENYEEYKRKFLSWNEKDKYTFRTKGKEFKKSMHRIPVHNHEWKDWSKNPRNKVKMEENDNISNKDSESSSD